MKKETVALVALIVIVLGSLSAFVVATNTTLFSDLFTTQPTVAVGDCVNVTFIGRFASNQTVFDSSYGDWKNRTSDSPLNIYVSYNKTATAWKAGYAADLIKDRDMIKPFMDALIGMKEGQTKTIGPILPKDAYGQKLSVGNRFYTQRFTWSSVNNTLNQTLEVTNMSNGNITLQWVNISLPVNKNFTMPEGVFIQDFASLIDFYSSGYQFFPYYLWQNSSRVVNITNDSVNIRTTPTRSTNISQNVTYFYYGNGVFFVFPNATTVTWNDTKIVLDTDVMKGTHYIMMAGNDTVNLTIGNISASNINVTAEFQGNAQSLIMNKTVIYNRTYLMPRLYKLPFDYMGYPLAQIVLGDDLKKVGYSLDAVAGQNLTYEITVDKIFKNTQ